MYKDQEDEDFFGLRFNPLNALDIHVIIHTTPMESNSFELVTIRNLLQDIGKMVDEFFINTGVQQIDKLIRLECLFNDVIGRLKMLLKSKLNVNVNGLYGDNFLHINSKIPLQVGSSGYIIGNQNRINELLSLIRILNGDTNNGNLMFNAFSINIKDNKLLQILYTPELEKLLIGIRNDEIDPMVNVAATVIIKLIANKNYEFLSENLDFVKKVLSDLDDRLIIEDDEFNIKFRGIPIFNHILEIQELLASVNVDNMLIEDYLPYSLSVYNNNTFIPSELFTLISLCLPQSKIIKNLSSTINEVLKLGRDNVLSYDGIRNLIGMTTKMMDIVKEGLNYYNISNISWMTLNNIINMFTTRSIVTRSYVGKMIDYDPLRLFELSENTQNLMELLTSTEVDLIYLLKLVDISRLKVNAAAVMYNILKLKDENDNEYIDEIELDDEDVYHNIITTIYKIIQNFKPEDVFSGGLEVIKMLNEEGLDYDEFIKKLNGVIIEWLINGLFIERKYLSIDETDDSVMDMLNYIESSSIGWVYTKMIDNETITTDGESKDMLFKPHFQMTLLSTLLFITENRSVEKLFPIEQFYEPKITDGLLGFLEYERDTHRLWKWLKLFCKFMMNDEIGENVLEDMMECIKIILNLSYKPDKEITISKLQLQSATYLLFYWWNLRDIQPKFSSLLKPTTQTLLEQSLKGYISTTTNEEEEDIELDEDVDILWNRVKINGVKWVMVDDKKDLIKIDKKGNIVEGEKSNPVSYLSDTVEDDDDSYDPFNLAFQQMMNVNHQPNDVSFLSSTSDDDLDSPNASPIAPPDNDDKKDDKWEEGTSVLKFLDKKGNEEE